jgi:hypothetical protein
MVFLLGGWGMGDSELKHHTGHYDNAPRQFLCQHPESYDENEVSLIPLGNQVSTLFVILCTFLQWYALLK